MLDDFATEGQAFIPLEQLSVLDAGDVLLWATESPADRPNIEAEPLYRTLPPYEEGQLVHRRRHGGSDLLHEPAEPAVPRSTSWSPRSPRPSPATARRPSTPWAGDQSLTPWPSGFSNQ